MRLPGRFLRHRAFVTFALPAALPAAICILSGILSGELSRTPAAAAGSSVPTRIRRQCDKLNVVHIAPLTKKHFPQETCRIASSGGDGFVVHVRRNLGKSHRTRVRVGEDRIVVQLHAPDDTGKTCDQASIRFFYARGGELKRLVANPVCVLEKKAKPKSEAEQMLLSLNDGDWKFGSLAMPTREEREMPARSFALNLPGSAGAQRLAAERAESGIAGAAGMQLAASEPLAAHGALTPMLDDDLDGFGELPEIITPVPAGNAGPKTGALKSGAATAEVAVEPVRSSAF